MPRHVAVKVKQGEALRLFAVLNAMMVETNDRIGLLHFRRGGRKSLGAAIVAFVCKTTYPLQKVNYWDVLYHI